LEPPLPLLDMMLVDVFEAFDVFERMEMSRLEEDIC
jgi:hypothetical protein